MTDLKPILINMVTLGILIFAIMSFIIIVQSDSDLDPTDRITNDSIINDSYGNLGASLGKEDESEDALDSLEDVPPQDYVGDLDVSSIVSATRTSRSIITGLWNVYVKLPERVGLDPLVSGGIGMILLILIAIGIWAVWKGAIS